jgi:hypothetical protein
MSDWQPIETAPKDGTRFLAIYVPKDVRLICYRKGRWQEPGDDHGLIDFEYWHPLPALPDSPTP